MMNMYISLAVSCPGWPYLVTAKSFCQLERDSLYIDTKIKPLQIKSQTEICGISQKCAFKPFLFS